MMVKREDVGLEGAIAGSHCVHAPSPLPVLFVVLKGACTPQISLAN